MEKTYNSNLTEEQFQVVKNALDTMDLAEANKFISEYSSKIHKDLLKEGFTLKESYEANDDEWWEDWD